MLNLGAVYTPKDTVSYVLDICYNKDIIGKHILEHSCGDGAFLVQIVDRYCQNFKGSRDELKKHLETYIHAIEINEAEYIIAICRCNEVADKYGISSVNWDFRCADTLTVSDYDNKMDYIIGNPPYVRVHNLGINHRSLIKSLPFCDKGIQDLYIAFLSKSLQMLKDCGKLYQIIPNTFLNSKTLKDFRRYLIENQYIEHITDFQYNTFNASVFTILLGISKKFCKNFSYYNSDGFVCDFDYSSLDFYINDSIVLGSKSDIDILKEVSKYKPNINFDGGVGIQTSADNIFIMDEDFGEDCILDCYKMSTGQFKKCIYPYDIGGNLLNIDQIQEFCPKVGLYLSKNEIPLKQRNLSDFDLWWGYGRNQSLSDTYKNKIAVSNLISETNPIKIQILDKPCCVYGNGFYIIPKTDISFDIISEWLKSKEFYKYVKSLCKYKQGGYYIFNKEDLLKYLEYRYYKG